MIIPYDSKHVAIYNANF